jgi:phosphatidate cytidylyltransferase
MKRIVTAAFAIPIALAITIYSSSWVFAVVDAVVSAIMLHEFFELNTAAGGTSPGKWFLIPGALVALSFAGGPVWVLASVSASALLLMSASALSTNIKSSFSRVSTGLSGVIYCSVLFGFMVLLSRDAVLTVFAIVWAGDTGAFYGGRTFGRHALLPVVSPKKTVEGAIAGWIASVIAGTVVGLWRLGLPWLNLAVFSGIVAIAGQIGDLAESALKRSAGVKDSSSILPGHGGILDRLDSLLFAVPVFYWLLRA